VSPRIRFGFSVPLIEGAGDRPYAMTYELAQRGEDAGFEFLLLGHHSFTPESGEASAPFLALAALAARTSSIRLGTGIFLLPLHHPVAVAEQMATLDRLSGGRAILGVGVGYRPYEFEGFGVPYTSRGARMSEQLAIIRGAWESGRIEANGRFYDVGPATLDPPPVQQPGPPIWVGAVARAALERAANYGDVWLSDMMQTIATEQRLATRFRGFAAEAGREPEVCIMRMACIAERRSQVEQRWLQQALGTYKHYWDAGARGRDDEGIATKLDAGDTVTFEEFAPDRVIAGSPDDVIAQIERWHEATGCNYMHLGLSGAEEGPTGMVAAMALFQRHVLPVFS
jgi:probable F420-dependent oxidoreductase